MTQIQQNHPAAEPRLRGSAQDAALMVELRSVTVRFGETTAVEDLSLAVPRGGILALVGPSGCGKTTTLKMIAGLQPCTAGHVLLNGRDATNTPPERRKVGYVPQNYGLFPHMSVLHNVAYGLKVRRVSKDERYARARDAMGLAHITELEARMPSQLSGGQRQRVALARALATDPDVLLLDEPLAALDPQLRDDLRRNLGVLLRESGRTVVIVTHDQSEALALADQVAVMHSGRLLQLGTPEELWTRPVNSFVAEFVCRAVVLDGESDGKHVRTIGGWTLDAHCLGIPGRPGPVRLLVRPDSLEPTSEHGPHVLTVNVETTEYAGETVRVVGTASGQRLTVHVPPGTPVAAVTGFVIRPGCVQVLP